MQYKELEDYHWFPNVLRRFQMEIIGALVLHFGMYKNVAKQLGQLCQSLHTNTITDLCSGSGLPMLYCSKKLPHLQFNLTDKFPQPFVNRPNINYNQESVDIMQFLPKANELYTICNAWHHFSLEQQQIILEKFKKQNTTLFIVEILQPNIFTLIQVLLASTLGTLLIVPFIRPFNLLRLLLTYIIPINIITVLYDGIISVLKSKSVKRYKEELKMFESENYSIIVEELNQFPSNIVTILITPH